MPDPRTETRWYRVDPPAGLTPMTTACWAAIWYRYFHPASVAHVALKVPIVPISQRVAYHGGYWIHLCHPRTIYDTFKHAYVKEWRARHGKDRDFPKQSRYSVALFKSGYEIELLINDIWPVNFFHEFGYTVDWSVRRMDSKTLKCTHWGCPKELTKAERAKLLLMNVGG